MILIIKHIEIEGPGTIEDYLLKKGYDLMTVDLHKGDSLPNDLVGVEAIVSLGGPMNVYEEDKYPFLKDEDAFLKKAIKEEIPTLGICLGSQLIAKASGAKVVKSPVKEVGWFKIDLQKSAQSDSLFKGLDKKVDVYHWHEDMWELPKGAALLASAASASGCPHQAFKVGKYAYGVQFHVEITDKIIADWCRAYFSSSDQEKQKKAKEMVEAYPRKRKSLGSSCNIIYGNFVQMIEARKKQLNLAAK